MVTCARCGEDLTAPSFYRGKAYGYTCYKIVTGKPAKPSKAVWVSVTPDIDLDAMLTPETAVPYIQKIRLTDAEGNTYRVSAMFVNSDGGFYRSTNGLFHHIANNGCILMIKDAKGLSTFKKR